MAQITRVTIKNFMSIDSQIVFDELQKHNILAGLHGTVKKTFCKAIFFGLGASSEQLSVTQYSDLKNSGLNPSMSVQLTLKYNDRNYTVQRTLGSDNAQGFELNDRYADVDEYYDTLKELTFDVDKQMLFCDSANVMLLQSMIAAEPLSLLGTITGLKKQTNAAIKHSHAITQLTEELLAYGKIYRQLKHCADTLENALPELQQSHADQFTAYTISKLKREQAERTARKAELAVVESELNSRRSEIQRFGATIAEQTDLRDRKLNDNQSMLAQLTDAADGESCALVLGIRKMTCKRSLEQVHQRIGDALKLIAALERLKGEAEWNIAFMNGASGTKRKSKMAPRENVLKLYPIYHHEDELEMDKTELELLKKRAELAAAKNKNEIFDLMDQLLPLRQRKPMADPKPIQDIFSDIQSAIKDVLHPMAYMPPNDALKMEKLRSLIPSTEGFLLYGTFRANDAQHQELIDNILTDYMYTIALYKDDRQSVYEMLQRNYPEWCTNVKYLVLSQLPSPSSRTAYVPPPDHWLTYCTFTYTNIDDKSRQKLMYYMGRHLEIRCVETHDSVKEAFQRRTKKYVASLDGQLIYGQCSFGFDVLTYTTPGNTTMKDMRLPAACQRLEDAMRKLNEFTSTFIETENVPRNRPVSNIVALEADLLVHEQKFAQQQQQKNDRIETLHQLTNAPYEAPDVQDYTDALVAERHRLDDINRRITATRNEIAQCTAETARLTLKIDELAKCIELKGKLTVNEQDIVRHNAAITASEQKIAIMLGIAARLQLKYDDLMRAVTSLKYETTKTALRAYQANIDLSTVDCATQPPTLWQDIRNGIYVPPLTMSVTFNDMTDTFDPDVFYANRHWYAVRDIYKEKAVELNETINVLSAKLDDSKKRLNGLRDMIVRKFTDCIQHINLALNGMVDTIHPRDDNVAYELSFKCDDILSDRAAIFKMIINGDAVDFKSLSNLEQMRSSWLLFAALNEYSKAPFAFIDLEQMDENSELGKLAIIDPIIRRMADKIQLFIDSSSPNHSHFAKVHYGLKANENAANIDERVMVVRHDASQFVTNDGRRGRDSNVDGSGGVNQRDENVDQRDGNVDQRDGNVDDGNVDQRDGNVDQRDGNVDQRDGNVDQRDGNVDQRDGNVDQRDGNVDQRDGNVDDGNVDDVNVDDVNVDDGNVDDVNVDDGNVDDGNVDNGNVNEHS